MILSTSPPGSPEEGVLTLELRELAREAVDTLGEPDCEIFKRHYFLYQKTEDIAAALGHERRDPYAQSLRAGGRDLNIILRREGTAMKLKNIRAVQRLLPGKCHRSAHLMRSLPHA